MKALLSSRALKRGRRNTGPSPVPPDQSVPVCFQMGSWCCQGAWPQMIEPQDHEQALPSCMGSGRSPLGGGPAGEGHQAGTGGRSAGTTSLVKVSLMHAGVKVDAYIVETL